MTSSTRRLSPAAIPRLRISTRTRKYRGTLYIAGPDQAFELDDLAEHIFLDIDGTRTIAEIGERVAAEYHIPVPQAVPDAADAIAQFVESGLVDLAE